MRESGEATLEMVRVSSVGGGPDHTAKVFVTVLNSEANLTVQKVI